MSIEMRGLSLYQPWATLVAIGAKAIETRSWPTNRRGWVAIHATRSFPDDAAAQCFFEPLSSVLKAASIRVPADLPRGAILAVANLHRCGRIVHRSDGQIIVDGHDLPTTGNELAFGDYTPGRFGWVLTNVQPLREPIPCRGYQGLWPVPADVVAQIARQLPAGSLGR
jgi:hypothetical protein